MSCARWIILSAGLMILSACAGLSDRTTSKMTGPADRVRSEQASRIVSGLKQKNTGLLTFKGVGKLKLIDGARVQSVRIMWAAALDEKIRFELRTFAGQPVAGIAGDGKWLYAASYRPEPVFRKQSANNSLKRIIAVPIHVTDMIELIAGRIPMADYRDASLVSSPGQTGYVLELRKSRGRVLEKIYLDDTLAVVKGIERFDGSGKPAYRARFFKFRSIDGFHIPHRIELTGENGRSLELIIEQYWPNVSIPPSAFVLTPPDDWR